jgi:hypothetical protein
MRVPRTQIHIPIQYEPDRAIHRCRVQIDGQRIDFGRAVDPKALMRAYVRHQLERWNRAARALGLP